MGRTKTPASQKQPSTSMNTHSNGNLMPPRSVARKAKLKKLHDKWLTDRSAAKAKGLEFLDKEPTLPEAVKKRDGKSCNCSFQCRRTNV